MAQRGELDLFFLSGVQIDQYANINLHVIGDHDRPKMRFPGGYGSGMLYYMAHRVVLFRTEHTKRTLVPRVDFIGAAGSSPAGVYRGGGPAALMTPMAQFDWDRAAARWALAAVHPGHTVAATLDNMGFEPLIRDLVPTSAPPSAEELRLLRTVVREKLLGVYPDFARNAILASV
jgi:glutaconate CoA-transferase subunit B